MGTPGQPQNVKAAKASSGAIRVTYQAPANNGATITTYTAGCNSTNGGVNRTRTIKAPRPRSRSTASPRARPTGAQ